MPASWTAPVIDRTALDVENLTAKGYYNILDINRIEENLDYLADLATSMGYTITITADYTWLVTEIFDEADVTRVLGNIDAIRTGYRNPSWAPDTPEDMAYMTYVKANTLEQIIYDLKAYMDMETAGNIFYRAGEVNAGAGGLI